MPFSVLQYSETETTLIPSLKSSEVVVPMELATQFHFKKLKQEHISVTRLKGDLLVDNGKHRLVPGSKLVDQKCKPVLCWGSPDIERLLAALSERGIKGTVAGDAINTEFEDVAVVHVLEPNRACIEIRVASTVITTADENLAFQISDAICSVLTST